jgi:uncharacterized protein (TIGR03435 family)
MGQALASVRCCWWLSLTVGATFVASVTAQGVHGFEVASIRMSAQRPTGSMGQVSPERFSRRYTTLSTLVSYAYEVTPEQIQGGPDWMRSQRFDVDAKADAEPTAMQMRMMVRQLLVERFRLKVHVETKELPRYALVTVRNDGQLGERVRPSQIDCSSENGRVSRDVSQGQCAVMTRSSGDSVTMVVRGTRLHQFAQLLQNQAGRVVVDKTGLTGTYDIELEVARQSSPGEVSLFTALQEELGLKLQPERGPVQVLLIDHAEQPTPN